MINSFEQSYPMYIEGENHEEGWVILSVRDFTMTALTDIKKHKSEVMVRQELTNVQGKFRYRLFQRIDEYKNFHGCIGSYKNSKDRLNNEGWSVYGIIGDDNIDIFFDNFNGEEVLLVPLDGNVEKFLVYIRKTDLKKRLMQTLKSNNFTIKKLYGMT